MAFIKNGSILNFKNSRMKVVEFQHVKPGKGPAFVRTKLKDIQSGKVIDQTFNAGVKLEFIRVSIGLYNDANELLLVAKLGQPIPISDNTDTTFVIRYDQ
jgi:elongation factor P